MITKNARFFVISLYHSELKTRQPSARDRGSDATISELCAGVRILHLLPFFFCKP